MAPGYSAIVKQASCDMYCTVQCVQLKKKNTQGYKVKFRKSFLNLPSHKGWGESALSNKLHSVSCKVQIVKEDPDPQKLLEVSHWQQHAPGFIWPLRVALGVCVVFSAMRNSQPSHRVLTHLEQGHYMHQAVWLSLQHGQHASPHDKKVTGMDKDIITDFICKTSNCSA